MVRECNDIARDISRLESELSASGSTATSDDIQEQLGKATNSMYVDLGCPVDLLLTEVPSSISRVLKVNSEKLRSESTILQSQLQSLTSQVHASEMELSVSKQNLKEQERLEERKESERTAIAQFDAEVKVRTNLLRQ